MALVHPPGLDFFASSVCPPRETKHAISRGWARSSSLLCGMKQRRITTVACGQYSTVQRGALKEREREGCALAQALLAYRYFTPTLQTTKTPQTIRQSLHILRVSLATASFFHTAHQSIACVVFAPQWLAAVWSCFSLPCSGPCFCRKSPQHVTALPHLRICDAAATPTVKPAARRCKT